jgi:hypothetical protein
MGCVETELQEEEFQTINKEPKKETKEWGPEPTHTKPKNIVNPLPKEEPKPEEENNLPSCANDSVFLTYLPVDLNKITGITPLGNLNPPGHTFPTPHMYFNIIKRNEQINLYSPGNITITQISSYEYPKYTEYSIYLSSCKELSFYFYHVSSLSKKLKDQLKEPEHCEEYGEDENKNKHCYYDVNIEVKAGELLGTTGSDKEQSSLDFGARDERLDLEYNNKRRSLPENVACPLDYFKPNLKQKLYDKTERTIEPICGTVYYNIPNTAQGTWFLENSKDSFTEEPHLALVPHNHNPEDFIISLGKSLPDTESQAYFIEPKPGLSNTAFNKIKPGTIHCYETTYENLVFIIQLMNSNTLQIEKLNKKHCSKGPWKFTNPTTFER